MSSVTINAKVKGHVHIEDRVTGEVLLDRFNAIHDQNMAMALARGLANDANFQIYQLKLGNGGSSVDSTGQITYQTPNVTGPNADLYNTTYFEIVDESQANCPPENSVTFQQSTTDLTSIVITTMTIAAGEPSGQLISDSPGSTDPNSQYAFDELGLFTADNKLLTHIVFSPILKTQNRELVITYTLTVSVS